MTIKMGIYLFENGVVKNNLFKKEIRESIENSKLIYLDFKGINSIFETDFRELFINILSNKNILKKIKIINATTSIKRTLKIVINNTIRKQG